MVNFTTATAAYDFPDANFRQYLLDNFDSDKSGKLSESEVLKVTEIDCSDMNIASLQGIEYFRNLIYLECSYNPLTALDVSKCTALTQLYCSYNQLIALDVTKCTALTDFACSYNQFTTLDVSKCTALNRLFCSDNKLTTLDVSKCTALNRLDCDSNVLTTLDVSECTALTELDCSSNSNLATLTIKRGTCPNRYYSGTLIFSDVDITWIP